MAVRRLKNGRLVVELEVGRVRIFRRLPAVCGKADAQALEARIRRELWERSALGRPDEPSLAAAIELWLRATEADRKDKRSPRQNARHLRAFVEGKTCRQVGEAAMEALQEWSAKSPESRVSIRKIASEITALTQPTGLNSLSAPKKRGQLNTASMKTSQERDGRTGLSAATINRRLDVLRAATRWAWKQGMLSENLSGRVPRLREENARQVYLTPGQIRLLASKAPTPVCRAAIMLAAYTGLRASELLAIRTLPASSVLSIEHSKTGKPRVVPVPGPARPYLRALPLGCSYRRLIGWFWVARAKAGMKHVHFHDLRHSFASMFLAANNGNLFLLSKILGHTTIQTTMRYSHLVEGQARKAMGRLK